MDLVGQQHPDVELVAGRYRALETVGRGGMGRVRRAEDLVLRRVVALKEIALPPGTPDEERAHLLDRIRREARIASQLNHPGIVRVHDIVDHEGSPVIVMEYLDGRSLGAVIREDGPVNAGSVARIAGTVLAALAYAHTAGVVHRDLKPDNIVLTHDGRTVLTDFGIARTMSEGTPLTMPGAMIGTPAFMAPEQVEGKQLTSAADLWALGATLYAALEGKPPFEGESMTEICVGILTRPVPEPRNAGPLAPLLDALLTKDPATRATSEQVFGFLDDLQRVALQRTVPQQQQPAGQRISGHEPSVDAWATMPDAEALLPATNRAAGLGVVAAGVVWIASMALPFWQWPLTAGRQDTLSGWDLLTGHASSADAEWWLPAVAVIVIAGIAGATFVSSLSRWRPYVCWAALPVGVIGIAILLAMGVPGNVTHFNNCVADQRAYGLSVDEVQACADAHGFDIGFYVGVAALLLLVVCGLWTLLSRRARRASAQASLLG